MIHALNKNRIVENLPFLIPYNVNLFTEREKTINIRSSIFGLSRAYYNIKDKKYCRCIWQNKRAGLCTFILPYTTQLREMGWMNQTFNLILLVPPDVGKTPLAIGLGI